MRYKIKNWHTYQHYKDRCPPWVKLHHSLLTSKVWILSNDASRALLIASMLLAGRNSENDGSFDGDPEYIKRFAYLNSKPDFKQLIELDFIELVQDASNMLAKCNTETETETETDIAQAEKKLSAHAVSFDFATGEFSNVNGQLIIWKNAYPAVSVESELKKAAAWLMANPKNKKSNYSRFLNSWLSRSQDSAKPVRSTEPKKAWE